MKNHIEIDLKGRTLRLLLASLLALLTISTAIAAPAQAKLASRGPIDPENGFPYWYEDASGTKLDLCLNADPATSKCLLPFEMPDQNAPMVFPDNFPGEAFWWTGEAHIDRADGGRALLVLAQEAAFANENPREGDQMSFGRIRIRLDQLVPGATYTVTHPYGVDQVVAEEDGSIFVTEDIGCFPSTLKSCNFDSALTGRIGPFLKWDEGAPAGYVGDPDVPHTVVGSPIADPSHPSGFQNYFKVEGPGVGGPGVNTIQTDLFSVSGKLAELQVKATGAGGEVERAQTVFNDANQKVQLVASEPGARIHYTTDGSEPTEQSTLYNPSAGVSLDSDPNSLTGTTTEVRFFAINGEQRSQVMSKSFEVDLRAPLVKASVPSGTYEEPQFVELTTNEKARTYYTTDGSNPDPRAGDNPAVESFVYNPGDPATAQAIDVSRSQKVRTIAVDLDPVSGAEVNWSQPKSYNYSISNLKVGPINPQNGFPFWYEDRNGTRLDLCLNPVAAPALGGGYCATPFEMPPGWQPSDGVSFPDKFPGEAFWYTAESGMDTSDRGSADLIMAMEAAFLNEVPNANDRMVFGRIRIRIDDLIAGEKYTVTHPYGVDIFVAEPVAPGSTVGEINTTEDIGCMMPTPEEPCDFNEARFSRVGPFLTKDMDAAPNQQPAPQGWLADPVTDEDVVKGSVVMAPENPNDPNSNMVPANFFRVEGPGLGTPENPNLGTAEKPYIQTNFFSIVGKLSEFQAAASQVSGSYNAPFDVALGASEFDARIHYTLDGSEPTTSSPLYTGPITVDAMNQATTLKFLAVNPATGEQTPVYTENYTLDNIAPRVESNVAPGDYQTAQNVTLTALEGDTANAEQGAKIYYTTDGTEPTAQSTLYTAPIRIETLTTLKAIAIDAAGNQSAGPAASFTYNVQIPATSLTATATPAPVNFGRATTLSGQLTSSDPTVPVANKQIVVEQSAPGSGVWTATPNGQLTTAPDGSYSLRVRPTEHTVYRVRFTGDDGLQTSRVTERVSVRSVVSLDLSTRNVTVGRKFNVSGDVRPAHTGSVTITIERGNRVEFRKVLNLRGSAYSYSYAPRRTGTYTVNVRFAGDADHLGDIANSPTIRSNPR